MSSNNLESRTKSQEPRTKSKNTRGLRQKAKKKSRIFGWAFLVLSAFVVFACGPFYEYTENKAIDDASWASDRSFRFNYLSKDTTADKDLFINLRHTGLYKYNNIYLFVTVIAPNGESLKDTVEFTLANPEGKWAGKGIGDLYDVKLAYKHNIRFGQSGKYSFLIQHGMRDLQLKEVTDIGICIQDLKK